MTTKGASAHSVDEVFVQVAQFPLEFEINTEVQVPLKQRTRKLAENQFLKFEKLEVHNHTTDFQA